MLRRMMGLSLVLAIGAVSIQAQEPKAETPKAPEKKVLSDLEKKFQEIQKDLNKRAAEARKKAQEAKNDAEAQKIFQETLKLDEFKEKFSKLVEENPKDEAIIPIVGFVVGRLGGDGKKMLPILEANHIENKKIATLAQMFMNGGPPEAKEFLKKIVAKNPDRDVKGISTYALANIAFEEGNDGNKASAAEAEKLFDIIEKQYGDVKAGRSTLAEMAKNTLFELRNLSVGKQVPDAAGTRLDGKKEKLSDYKGKVVVIDIWATWCGPCRAMIPHEREMVEKLKDKPFSFISVSGDDEKSDLEEFLKNEKMPWIHWWDARGKGIVSEWNIRFFPTIYIVDAKGVIRHKGLRGEELEKAVEELIKEAAQK
jgi:thiol-disulfide isomerase/thioredoxin